MFTGNTRSSEDVVSVSLLGKHNALFSLQPLLLCTSGSKA